MPQHFSTKDIHCPPASLHLLHVLPNAEAAPQRLFIKHRLNPSADCICYHQICSRAVLCFQVVPEQDWMSFPEIQQKLCCDLLVCHIMSSVRLQRQQAQTLSSFWNQQVTQRIMYNSAPRKTKIKLPLQDVYVRARGVYVRFLLISSCVRRLLERKPSPRRDTGQCCWTSQGQLESQGAQHEQQPVRGEAEGQTPCLSQAPYHPWPLKSVHVP